jgi:molybdenum cofactor cytidylyltransferase
VKLHEAFEVVRGDVVAFIGAGGKTSTMLELGHELRAAGWRVLATTTTRMAEEQLQLMPHAMPYRGDASAVSEALSAAGMVFLYDRIENGKVFGPRIDWSPSLLDSIDSDVLLVEADGARGLPFKAPHPHEPVLPRETSLVISLASMSVVGQSFDEAHVYNPRAMQAVFGYPDGAPVRATWIADVLGHAELGLRGIPPETRVVVYLNQTPDRGYLTNRARRVASIMLQSERIAGVAIGSSRAASPVMEVHRAIGAVVLAAGASTRMGAPKVLLPWSEDKTILTHIVEQLYRARVQEVVIVTGHHAPAVRAAMRPLGVRLVHNRAFRSGEMLSSLKAGLRAMPDHIAAVLMVLGDQPALDSRVIYRLLRTYAREGGIILAPSYQKRRGHPVLVARPLWQAFLDLPRNGAPRDVLLAHADQITYVDVETDSILRDVDTPDEYRDALRRAGLELPPSSPG